MSGLDTLIAKFLKEIVKNNLGVTTCDKIEKRLLERHGVGFTQAVEEFEKLDSVLREFFGGGAEGIEKQILNKILILDEAKYPEKKWITLEDSRLIDLLLKTLGDEDKKNIINAAINKPMIISDIVEISKTPQTSGYRKANALIDDGILVPLGFVRTHDGKPVTKYKAIFENISISIEKEKIVVKVQPIAESIKDSYVMKIICSRVL